MVWHSEKELRPDKVLINKINKECIIVDYKLGSESKDHILQINKYVAAYSSCGFEGNIKAYLFYVEGSGLKKVL